MRSRGSVERCEIMADMDEEQVSIRFSDVIEANGDFWVVSWLWLAGWSGLKSRAPKMKRRVHESAR